MIVIFSSTTFYSLTWSAPGLAHTEVPVRSPSGSNLNSLKQGGLEIWRAPEYVAIPIAGGSFGEKQISA